MIQTLYDRFLRPYLPRKIAVFNTVAVRQPRLLDATDVRPTYERALVNAIRDAVTPGDRVVIVGGGWGVSSVAAARRTGDDGSVVTFEASETYVDRVRETVELNGVADRVDVRHAIVGEERRLYGEAGDAGVLSPEELPECDVLVLDCEGAELAVLSSFECRPSHVVVETHPMYDAPTEQVTSLLTDAGYAVVNVEAMEVEQGVIDVVLTERA